MGFSEFPVGIKVVEHTDIDKAYSKEDLVFVRSSNSLDKNKKIIRLPVDGIIDPFFPKAKSFDTGMLNIARDNNIVIVITLTKFLEARGVERARLVVNGRRLVNLANKSGVSVLLTTGAMNRFQLRVPLQLISLGVILGMTPNRAKWSLSKIPESLARRKG